MNFPLFVNLQGKHILIVGAGLIAARRATVLVEFGAEVTVVAPKSREIPCAQNEKSTKSSGDCPVVSIGQLAQSHRLVWKQRKFEESDLERKFLVIAATNDSDLNDRIAQLCKAKKIPVNHAGDQKQCDFQFPAIVRNDPIVIGINAGGKDHGLVRRMAARLRLWIAQAADS